MTAAICGVCGRDIKPADEDEFTCMRLGYERQKARAEAAEEGQKQHEEFEAKAVSGWKACILERDALRAERDEARKRCDELHADVMEVCAELDAIRAEAASGRVSAPELVNDTMKAAWREGADCSDLRIAQKFVAAITHERTIAAQQRRELVKALRGVEKMSDEREGMGFIERLFRCGQIARAALATAGSP